MNTHVAHSLGGRIASACALWLSVSLFLLPGAVPVNAATVSSGPAYQYLDLPPGARPVLLDLKLHLLQLQGINDQEETFEFSAVLTLTWQDRRQAFDAPLGGVQRRYFHGNYQFNELSPAWYPQVVITNAVGSPELDGVLLEVGPDGTSTLTQVVHAVIRADLQLLRYPFDEQRLEIAFDILGFDDTQVKFALGDDAVSVDLDAVHTPQWKLRSVSAHQYSQNYLRQEAAEQALWLPCSWMSSGSPIS